MSKATTRSDTRPWFLYGKILAVSSVALLAIAAITGCGHDTTSTTNGTVITNRQSGTVYRVHESVVLELPRVPLSEQRSGRVIEQKSDIAGGAFEVTGRVKLLSTTVLWRLQIGPSSSETDAAEQYSTELRRLLALQRASGNLITLDLRDDDGFLVLPIDIALDIGATSVVNDEGETSALMYEGSEALAYDAISVVNTLDFRWRF